MDVGRTEAWRINRRLHCHTLKAAADARWRVILCVAPDSALTQRLPGVWPHGVKRAPQGAGDLGARLARALRVHGRVAVVGTDCPGLSRSRIAMAFKALQRAPFVLGPAADGGFWLLAARNGGHAARAMANVRWSSPNTASDVLRNLGPKNVALLETLHDVDTAADLKL